VVDEIKDRESAGVLVSAIPAERAKTRKSWSQLKRDLTDEELASPAAVKMLLDEVDRLDFENEELTGYVDRFHEADKTCAVLREQQKSNLASDIVFTAAISLGGVLLGLLSSVRDRASFWPLLGVGVLMVATGIAAKAIGR
jgi:hypothetical protein